MEKEFWGIAMRDEDAREFVRRLIESDCDKFVDKLMEYNKNTFYRMMYYPVTIDTLFDLEDAGVIDTAIADYGLLIYCDFIEDESDE